MEPDPSFLWHTNPLLYFSTISYISLISETEQWMRFLYCCLQRSKENLLNILWKWNFVVHNVAALYFDVWKSNKRISAISMKFFNKTQPVYFRKRVVHKIHPKLRKSEKGGGGLKSESVWQPQLKGKFCNRGGGAIKRPISFGLRL